MLNVHDLSVEFGGETLFQGVGFQLMAGDRVGLAGKNGAGKTTLLKILSGEQEATGGVVAIDKDIQIGFLKQDIDFVQGRTVLEEAYQAFEELKAIELRLEQVNTQLEERKDYHSEAYHRLMVDLNELTHRYEILGGYNYTGEAERILRGLGFQRSDFQKSSDTFSGGWRMRIELAKLLLQRNDILLLDEPTNHLDIESILWLEQFLRDAPGAVVIISHDRMFLDNVTNRTIEISRGRIYDHPKNYSKYLIYREEMLAQQRAAKKNQEKHIAHTEKLIEKFRAKASKATMAQSLIKKLDKIDRIELDERDNTTMKMRFPQAITPGKVVMTLKDVKKSYGDKVVLSGVDLVVERGAKIALVGQNGQGKTTLARIMVSALEAEGMVRPGHNVEIGYFAQNQVDYLNGDLTVLETMEQAANDINRVKVRDILGAFLFQGDEVYKKVKVLSGGERNRLALAKMLLTPSNMMVMDEPTNHLDIDSKKVLKEALLGFDGTLVLVSHDREFLQGLCSKVYEFRDRRITEYLGDIDHYLQERNLKDMREAEKASAFVKSTINDKGGNEYQKKKQQRSVKNELGKIERQITELEKELANIEVELTINYGETIAQPNFFDQYQAKRKRLDTLMEEWGNLQEKLEALNRP